MRMIPVCLWLLLLAACGTHHALASVDEAASALNAVLHGDFQAKRLGRYRRVWGKVESDEGQPYFAGAFELDADRHYIIDRYEVVHHRQAAPDRYHFWVLFHRLGETTYAESKWAVTVNRFVRVRPEQACARFSLSKDPDHGWLLVDPMKPSVSVDVAYEEARQRVAHLEQARDAGDFSHRQVLLSHSRGELAVLRVMREDRGEFGRLPAVACPPNDDAEHVQLP
jgi:hypothetical protein